MTRHPPINIDDIISGVDRVARSIVECLELVETALHHPCGSAYRIPFGLRNNITIYSDQIRVSMENLHISNLVQPTVDQVRFDLVPEPDASYQDAVTSRKFRILNNALRCPDRKLYPS
jgi:hypothetical protein